MFVTMAVDHLLTSFILLLICNTGFSAEISVFVKTGDSVQLDIQTQELSEFYMLSWFKDKSQIIVSYMHESRTVRLHPSYKDRVDFSDKTFSLTLKNMQKTDTGLYTAITRGESENNIVTYRVSVIGFSAEISVFVKTGDSVQLDIQTQKLPEFDLLSWTNDKLENIVKYIHESKKVKLHSSYKDRVDFNDETFSLTLKNMQKTDTGLYTARTRGESENNIVTYRVSVIDAVDAPVLTVNSHWSSSDSCTVNFTCRAHDLMINSNYQNNRCSPQEVTSQINTLILDCSKEAIICNYSNPVSWQKDLINIRQLCGGFSAEISVFVKTGDSVQLDIQTQELSEFDDLSWRNDKSENIVKYIHESKKVRLHSSYKDRVDFNNKTFSLTLKNMQKTDTGLYTAITHGESENNIAIYRVSVIGES
ncbi:hypothetical protein PO909_031499 [Leuciscus waleckii]